MLATFYFENVDFCQIIISFPSKPDEFRLGSVGFCFQFLLKIKAFEKNILVFEGLFTEIDALEGFKSRVKKRTENQI